jgi:transcriptional regulator with XRE-family HTH domain
MLYFDTLPYHPQPQPLESLTSYLTRLTVGNSFSSFSNLGPLSFPSQRRETVRRMSEFGPVSWDEFSKCTACSEDRLKETAFFHFVNKFGKTFHPRTVSRFLSSGLCDNLRWCPYCLAEEPSYYRLPWRFTFLQGCVEHQCQLAEVCPECNETIVIFPVQNKTIRLLFLQTEIGRCPNCGGNLCACRVQPLDNKALVRTHVDWENLLFLLTRHPCEKDALTMLKKVGDYLKGLRVERGITRIRAAELLNCRKSNLLSIELGMIDGFHLLPFLHYIQFLEMSVKDVFEKALSEFNYSENVSYKLWRYSKLGVQRESLLLDRVELAIQNSLEEGTTINQENIASRMGISQETLRSYPSLVARIMTCSTTTKGYRLSPEERKLFFANRAKTVLEAMLETNQRITQLAVAEALGVTRNIFRGSSELKSLIQNYSSRQNRPKGTFEEQEIKMLNDVILVVESLRLEDAGISLRKIATRLNTNRYYLQKFPRVRRYIESHISPDFKKSSRRFGSSFQESEAILLKLVASAIEDLKKNDERVSQYSIARKLHVSRNTLCKYPRVKGQIEKYRTI